MSKQQLEAREEKYFQVIYIVNSIQEFSSSHETLIIQKKAALHVY